MGNKNYTRYANRQEKKVIAEPVEHDAMKDYAETSWVEEEKKPDPINGVVTDCMRLNVRSEPSLDGRIVCAIDCLTEVIIYEDESAEDFYKICTVSGIEGFCMKKFIAIR